MTKAKGARSAAFWRASTLLTLAAGIQFALPGSANAQQAPAPQGGAVSAVESEIVVTATKRGETVAQDVPIAITAYSTEQLQALNFNTLASLTYNMPNVQLEDIGTAKGVANFDIRGIGINSSIPSVDPTVGVFVDGMYLGLNAGVVTNNFDLQGVEVLRGPQGTLYGRNVTGGAVLLRTRAPTDQFEANLHLGVETGLEYIADGSISGPIFGDTITAKLAIFHDKDDGWFKNQLDGSSFGASETNIYRGALRFAPGPGFEAILRLEHGEADGDGPASQNHALYSRHSFDFSVNNRGYGDSSWDQAILEANWDVGGGTVTNILGWRTYDSRTSGDIDATGTNLAALGGGTAFHSRSVTEQDQISEELRYAGTFGSVDVTGGLYYFQQDLKYIEERLLLAAAGPVFITRVGGGDGDFSTMAAFANADWHASETITFNFGLRYSQEDKDAQVSRIRRAADNLDGATVVPGEGVVGGSIDARTLAFSDSPFSLSWDDTSPRLGVQWQPSDDTNFYAYWARGFRAGGVNFRTTTINPPGGSGAPRAFDPEQTDTFEAGLKQDFGDGRARLNLAVFHNTIQNMQRETNVPETGSGVQQVIVNAGTAQITGFEFEGRFRFTDNFLITAQAGYVHGKYDSVSVDLTGDGVITFDDLDQHIPRLAPWSYGFNAIYDTHVEGGVISSRLGYNHRDHSYYNDANTGKLAEADIWDANFTFTPEQGNWSLAVYGRNLTNDPTWGGDTILPNSPAFGYSGGARPTFSPLNEGRVWGAEVRVHM